MPEGHTIHALAGRLNRAFAQEQVRASSPQGRFAGGAQILDRRVLVEAGAWGKNLFVEFDGDVWLHVHLGLIGVFPVVPLPVDLRGLDPSELPTSGAVRLRIAGHGHVADLRGPMTCALVAPGEIAALTGRLGPDPLRPDADPDLGWAKVSRSARPVAELLMDQAVVAGVGNVYRCEVLFRHRVDPMRPGKEIRRSTWRAIWDDLVRLLPLGVIYHQILTMDDQIEAAEAEIAAGEALRHTADLTGERLGDHFERRFFLYKRTGEPCLVCGSKVRAKPLAGRTLYWCGRCQRRR
ncbi:Fpg/Nei family DNA glycosylase [Occultella glacieicola]|uniref:DNA-(apurinic or apyrimidinic site) lyase n=1 Tax=Occultella glacieicola TaxID=2518684 RepID=A0ABY2E429_9MICO|nr:DNA-formamidopyrimidine glycosylase family protein [Occultella glacieicola]TDE94766.1 Fpg/Nei family DNA glycosylase [Occultella glacieicola]